MRENKPRHKIIAINPGWRCLGIAIFDGYQLREWRIKTLPAMSAKRKQEKAMDILSSFLERYDPKALAIKRLHPSRSSPNLKHLASSIIGHCRRQRIRVHSYAIKELKDAFSASRINKRALGRLVAREYPDLASELRREERNHNPYFFRLFEAVALGHVCRKEIINKHLMQVGGGK